MREHPHPLVAARSTESPKFAEPGELGTQQVTSSRQHCVDFTSSRPAPAQFSALVGHRRHVGIRGRYRQGVNPMTALAQIAEDRLGLGRITIGFHPGNLTIVDNVELISGNGWNRTKVT